MNEVKKVHLGRQQFTISVEAHRALRNYLEAIEKQPGVQAEVVKEVEMRMAELLTERGITKDQVVLQDDVDFLKTQLGEPGDFKDDQSEEAEDTKDGKKDEDRPKRLYRDTDNAMLAGVASGLAAYMGIDVFLVRIGFIVLTFASGAGAILYILIWLLAPEAKTPSDRLQMQGKAVTVDSLKEVIDRADIAGASSRAGRTLGRGLAQGLEVFAKVILGIIGLGVTVAGAATILWTIAMAVYMLIHGGQIGTEIAFPLGSREVWFTVLAFLTVAIVGFFLLMLGLTMMTRKWRLPTWLTAGLIGVFFVAGSVGVALGFDTIPHIRDRYRSAHHSQTRELQPFNTLSLEGENTRFVFRPDDKYSVELSYLGRVDAKPLTTTVENGRLTVKTSDFMKIPLCNGVCFYSDHDLVVTVHAPKIDDIHFTGPDNSFFIQDKLRQDKLTIEGHRYSFGTVGLSHNTADEIVLTDNNNASERLMTLNGIKPTDDDQQIRMDQDVVNINMNPINRFQLKTTATCGMDDPLVYLDSMPKELQVNDRVITASIGLEKEHTPDRFTDSNCLMVR